MYFVFYLYFTVSDKIKRVPLYQVVHSSDGKTLFDVHDYV